MICSLCMQKEGKLFENMRALYCDECFDARKASWGTVSEIIPGLFISGMREAEIWEFGPRICVHEDGPTYDMLRDCSAFIPILDKPPNSHQDRTGAVASIKALNQVSQHIHTLLIRQIPVLVHCWGGVERSPLAVAWFLVGYGYEDSLSDAYAFLKSKRPVVSDRTFWLPGKL